MTNRQGKSGDMASRATLRDEDHQSDITPCGTRSDGRKHDTGLENPYRPKPSDFRERFIEMGWNGTEAHYHTNWRVIRRWIMEEGKEELARARRAFMKTRRKRYVLGRTLTPVGRSDRNG